MQRLLLGTVVLTLALCGASVAADSPMVAYLYSTYRPGPEKQHDKIFGQLNWPHHKWENVRIRRLVNNLDRYDMILCHGIFNLDNTTDFKPYRQQWLKFLNQGGVIVVAGPQDTRAQWDWIVNLGKDFGFSLKNYSSFQKHSDWTNPKAELNFGTVKAQWAEFRDWSPKWTVTNRNVHGQPIVLYQRVGKGLIVVSTSYIGNFTRAEDLSKIWNFARQPFAGEPLKIKNISWGKKVWGRNDVNFTLDNGSTSSTDCEVLVRVFHDGNIRFSDSKTIQIKAKEKLDLSMPYALNGGANEISLVVRSRDGVHTYARRGTRRVLLDTSGGMKALEQHLKKAKLKLASLGAWPQVILEPLLEEHDELAAESAALAVELKGEHVDVQGVHKRIMDAAVKAKVLAGKVATYQNLRTIPKPGQRFVLSRSDSLQKVYRDRPWDSPAASNLNLEMAANEYESVQLVIVPLQGVLKDVRVICSELTSRSGASIQDIQIRPVADIFLSVQGKFGGWHPDVLLTASTFDISQDRIARGVWLTVYTSAETAPGVYSGTVSISAADAATVTLPISVKVWDFAVPHKRNLPTEFSLRPNQLARFYFGDKTYRDFEKYLPASTYRIFLEQLLKYRIAPYPYEDGEGESLSMVGYLGEQRDGTKVTELDFTEFDKNTQLMLDYGVELIYIGSLMAPQDHDRAKSWRTYLPKMYKHLQEKGWDKKAFAYTWDEFLADKLPHVRAFYKFVKEVAPTVRVLGTLYKPEVVPEANDIGYMDIWVPARGMCTQKLIDERAQHGQEVWYYIVGGFEVYHPTTTYRSHFWDVWQRKAAGFLYYCTAFFYWGPSPADFHPDGSPKKTFLYKGATGSYHLAYPASANPEDGLNASIRLEAIRDGLEDWEYCYVLKNMIERYNSNKSEQVRAATALMKQIDAEGTGQNLLARRRAIAEMIQKMKASP